MPEEKIAQFRERASAAVGLPDLDVLAQRGARLRRRRVAATAVAAVGAAAAIGFALLNAPDDTRTREQFVERPTSEASPEAATFADGLTLEPGVRIHDEFELSTGGTVRVELAAPAEGWFVYIGNPERGLNVGPERQWTGLLWQEALGVDQEPCDGGVSLPEEVLPMTDSLAPLLSQDWVTVVSGPRAERLGGRPAQHARVVVKSCDGNLPQAIATAGVSASLPGDTEFDLWLVPLPEADTAIVLHDPTGDGSDQVRRQWQQLIDSLEITVEPAP